VKPFPSPNEWAKQCEVWLQAALDASPIATHTLEHVKLGLRDGTAQLWPGYSSALVTEMTTYPTSLKTLGIWLAGGNLDEILETYWAIEEFAEMQDCSAIEVKGRRGWAPVMKQLGFGPASGTHFVKRLNDDG
jgi:hypothetical protein